MRISLQHRPVRPSLATASGSTAAHPCRRVADFLQKLVQGIEGIVYRRRDSQGGPAPRHITVERIDFRRSSARNILRGRGERAAHLLTQPKRGVHHGGLGKGNSLGMRYRHCLLEAVGEGTILAAHVSPIFRPAFPSSAIILEWSSPSRVRCAAPNNGAPLTAPGRSDNTFWTRGKGSCRTAYRVGGHFAAKMVPFFAATDNCLRDDALHQRAHWLESGHALRPYRARVRAEMAL